MQLGITIPLQKRLKRPAPPYGDGTDLFYCWELHNIKIHGREALIGVNASNRFAILLWGMEHTDWKHYPEIFSEAIRKSFRNQGYPECEIDRYFALAGAVEITKTHGRKAVASLNRMVDILVGMPVEMKSGELLQIYVGRIMNSQKAKAAGFDEIESGELLLALDMRRIMNGANV